MIYFLEHDADGVIYHVARNPNATIVPLINIAHVKNADGTPKPLAEPTGTDQATYDTLMADGVDKYLFDPSTGMIVRKQELDGE